MEGENSQVEMKLSSDMDEEVEANGVGENMKPHNGPYYPSKLSHRSPRNICCIVIGILLLFISGKKMCGYYLQYLHTCSVFIGCGKLFIQAHIYFPKLMLIHFSIFAKSPNAGQYISGHRNVICRVIRVL